jgi:hypothetical protein
MYYDRRSFDGILREWCILMFNHLYKDYHYISHRPHHIAGPVLATPHKDEVSQGQAESDVQRERPLYQRASSVPL